MLNSYPVSLWLVFSFLYTIDDRIYIKSSTMKKLGKILLLVMVISTGVTKMNEAKSQTNVSFSVFYNSLKPY
jgi:hypothetical protein